MLRTYALAALLSAVGAYKLPAIGTRVSHATPSTRASVRLDEDRCYYGKLDADGKAAVRSVAPLQVSGRLLISTPDSDRGESEPVAEGGRLKAGGAATKTARSKAPPAGAGAGKPSSGGLSVGVKTLSGKRSVRGRG